MRIKNVFRRLFDSGAILKYVFVFLLFAPLQVNNCFACRKVFVDGKKPIPPQFDKASSTYVIKDILDLNGSTLSMPNKCTLCFEGGRIVNGILMGMNTKIKGNNYPVFEKVEFDGSFIGTVNESWFPLRYDEYCDNSFELNSALSLAHLSDDKCFKLALGKVLYVRSDVDNSRWPTYLREGTVELRSGVTFDLNGSTIKCMTNSSHQYNILFSKDQEDICIKNGIICGDLETHSGKDGQWGHGIALEGVKNYSIENVECKQCWGDGVNLQVSHNGDGQETSPVTISGHCMNGRLLNVTSHHNRRQGMSIGGAMYLVVENCEFSDTKGSNPQSGVDIEPNKEVNLAAHITFRNCLFSSNAHQGLTLSGESIYDVSVKDCQFRMNGGYDISVRGKDVKIDNCFTPAGAEKLKVRFVANAKDVLVTNCVISRIYAQHSKVGDSVRNVQIKKCSFDWTNSNSKTGLYDDKKLATCSMTFEACSIDFRTLSSGANMAFVSSNKLNEYRFNKCIIDCGGRNLNVSSTLHFNGCEIKGVQSIVCTLGSTEKNTFDFVGCEIKGTRGRSVFEIDAPKGSELLFDLSKSKIENSDARLINSSEQADVKLKAKGLSMSNGLSVSSSKGKVRVIRIE